MILCNCCGTDNAPMAIHKDYWICDDCVENTALMTQLSRRLKRGEKNMTLRECAIITAHTGIFLGDFGEFHKYVEELMGRPVWTHELPELRDEIREKSKADFFRINREAMLQQEETVKELSND